MADIQELPQNVFQELSRRRRLMSAFNPPELQQTQEPSTTEQYMKAVGEYPRYENYQPSRLRQVMGVIAGLSGRPGAQRSVTDEPYYKSTIPYQQRLGALKSGAEFEMTGAKSAAEIYKNKMQAYEAEQKGKIQPDVGSWYRGRDAEAQAESQQWRPKTQQEAFEFEKIKNSPTRGVVVQNVESGKLRNTLIDPTTGRKMQDLGEARQPRGPETFEEWQRKRDYEVANPVREPQPKFILPTQQSAAYNQAKEEVLNSMPEAHKYYDESARDFVPPEAGSEESDIFSDKDSGEYARIMSEVERRAKIISTTPYPSVNKGQFGRFTGGKVK